MAQATISESMVQALQESVIVSSFALIKLLEISVSNALLSSVIVVSTPNMTSSTSTLILRKLLLVHNHNTIDRLHSYITICI